MPNYELSPTAEKDMQQVTRYTLNKWGSESLEKYITGLKATFDAIGNGDALKREFSKRFPTVLVTKYRYHFVFYIRDGLEIAVIIGVIHERRDVVNRLSERLT